MYIHAREFLLMNFQCRILTLIVRRELHSFGHGCVLMRAREIKKKVFESLENILIIAKKKKDSEMINRYRKEFLALHQLSTPIHN
jgi:hypothetical protein